MAEPDRVALQEQLQSIPFFAALDAASLEDLARLATWHEYAPGAIVFLEGETSAGLYTVQRGWVKVVKYSPDGREQALRYFGPGEAFSEIGIFQERRNPATAVALEASWEVLENSPMIIDRYREVTVSWGYSGDSIVNSMADIGWMVAGFLLASRLPVWASVALCIFFELFTLYFIRDNLALNVLMLVWPVEAVRQWQGMG